MMKIEKMNCPHCGKTLICIDGDDGVYCFWCDDCDIDITVKVND